MSRTSKARVKIVRVRDRQIQRRNKQDVIVTEEPLEIRLIAGRETRQLAVTMRTPGADFELATGFLFSEGIIQSRSDISQISYCMDRDLSQEQRYNVVNVQLRSPTLPVIDHLERHFFTTSACGVCGKTSIDALETRGLLSVSKDFTVPIDTITQLASQLREAQSLFDSTGGLHAVGLFDKNGELIVLREDVGRHNAMDKVIGWAVQQDRLPLHEIVVLVSGRASFELVQKALSAQVPIFCSVSAPSSLAVDLAHRFDMTLIGFLRGNDFNIYTSSERIQSQ